jgi:hypothetical protein
VFNIKATYESIVPVNMDMIRRMVPGISFKDIATPLLPAHFTLVSRLILGINGIEFCEEVGFSEIP